VIELAAAGADLNARDVTKCTPLQNAAHGTYSAMAATPAAPKMPASAYAGELQSACSVHADDRDRSEQNGTVTLRRNEDVMCRTCGRELTILASESLCP
jgi:hypothetical protein